MPGTPTPRFNVANLVEWGQLIKSWATHLDYVSQPVAAQPPRNYWVNTSWPGEQGRTPAPATIADTDANNNPLAWCLPPSSAVFVPKTDGSATALPMAVAMTVDEFKTRVAAAGVEISEMPTQYKNVIIVQGNVETMVMRLPPKDTLQGSEDDLLNGTVYPFRSFYAELYGGPPHSPTDRGDIMQLHANRIGEYTLNNCM